MQVITVLMFHYRSCARELESTRVPYSDHLAPEPRTLYSSTPLHRSQGDNTHCGSV